MKISNFDSFRKGELDGKLMTKVILLFFVLVLLGVVNASAVECPPGFRWEPRSGVGCVQIDCFKIEHAKYSYTQRCICEDGYKPCHELVDYTGFDESKCKPNCPRVKLIACVKPDEPCPGEKTPPKKNCRDYCEEKFDQKKPVYLQLFDAKGEYPFCYCICMDEQTGDEVLCWEESWDCEEYCSKGYKNEQWDGTSKWPYCECICKKGYEGREEGCVPCEVICREKGGEHYIEDNAKSEPNSCACTCEDGYEYDYSSKKCEIVDCPPNSTNVAKLGGACPQDRKLNRYCCCDNGFVPWEGTCLKEEDLPGKVVCGKWGCQEGEDCLNCPQDCKCSEPEICDPFSEYTNPETKCSPKVAYVFISSGIKTSEKYWILNKINRIRKYYRSLGYKTISVEVNDLDDVVDKLSNPSTKAIAYFGHAAEPSIEYSDAAGIKNSIYLTLYKKYQGSGINHIEADQRAHERCEHPNLDYAYIHTCNSLDDTSLADYLLRPGGTYWGEKGTLYAVEWLNEYVKK